MKHVACCIILLAAVLGAAPARSQVFAVTGDTSGAGFFTSTDTAFATTGTTFATTDASFFAVAVTPASASPPATASSTPSTATSIPATTAALTVNPSISGNAYSSVNGVTYSKTASGLLVVLSPAALTGTGPLSGLSSGLTIEIPDNFVLQLF